MHPTASVLSGSVPIRLDGSRGPKTPGADIKILQLIFTVLEGKVAEKYRSILNDLFLRYLAGDLSMIEELEANAASTALPNVCARQALAAGAASAPIADGAAGGAAGLETGTQVSSAPIIVILRPSAAPVMDHVGVGATKVAYQRNPLPSAGRRRRCNGCGRIRCPRGRNRAEAPVQ